MISSLGLKDEQRFWKRILIVDDDVDLTTTFKAVIEDSNNNNDVNRRIEVYTSNDMKVAPTAYMEIGRTIRFT